VNDALDNFVDFVEAWLGVIKGTASIFFVDVACPPIATH